MASAVLADCRAQSQQLPSKVFSTQRVPNALPLVHLSECLSADTTVDFTLPNSSTTGLLKGIAGGLLQPSFPLSSRAAEKLQQVLSGRQYQLPAGHLLRLLHVELLYDDTGLQLFDQVRWFQQCNLLHACQCCTRHSVHPFAAICFSSFVRYLCWFT